MKGYDVVTENLYGGCENILIFSLSVNVFSYKLDLLFNDFLFSIIGIFIFVFLISFNFI